MDLENDFFLPDTLLCVVRNDLETYLQAVDFYFGLKLSPGDGAVSMPDLRPPHLRPHVSEEVEYRFMQSLWADQHEKCHFAQFASTAVGVYQFIADAWYWDFCKQFVAMLFEYCANADPPKTPVLPLIRCAAQISRTRRDEIPEDLQKMAALQSLYSKVRQVFDDPEISIGDSVELWNRFADVNDLTSARQPGDDLELPRFEFKGRTAYGTRANRDGVTLRSLIESSARAVDIKYLSYLEVSPGVSARFRREALTGPYYVLIDKLSRVCEEPLVLPLLIRLVGIALQSPLTSNHQQLSGRDALEWEDHSPTCRFNTLVDDLATGCITAEQIIEDPSSADMLCESHGWMKITEIMRSYVSRSHFRGMNQTFGYFMDRHHAFCEYALRDVARPTWMPDLLWAARTDDSGYVRFVRSFYPPWQFAGGEVQLHHTCDPEVMLATCSALLTTVAAREMMYGSALTETTRLVDCLLRFFKKMDLDTVVHQMWLDVFRRTFGFRPTDVHCTGA